MRPAGGTIPALTAAAMIGMTITTVIGTITMIATIVMITIVIMKERCAKSGRGNGRGRSANATSGSVVNGSIMKKKGTRGQNLPSPAKNTVLPDSPRASVNVQPRNAGEAARTCVFPADLAASSVRAAFEKTWCPDFPAQVSLLLA